jgi:uncharacterized protein involved in exopolysaccharide biosynthesis
MEIEIRQIVKILWDWRRLIVGFVAITAVALGLNWYLSDPGYRAKVKLQITTPEDEDVSLFDQRSSFSERDRITIARNNFTVVLESSAVRKMTIDQLGLTGAAAEYEIEVIPIRDADFVDVFVVAGSPELAAEIANTHVAMAIKRMGDLRALPSITAKENFNEELVNAELTMNTAENAFIAFQLENGIASLDSEVSVQQQMLQQLELERNQLLFAVPAAEVDLITPIEALIEQREAELQPLLTLRRTFRSLQEDVTVATDNYEAVLAQYPLLTPEAPLPVPIQAAEEARLATEAALDVFLTEQDVVTLESDITMLQSLIEQLNLERDQRLLARPLNDQTELIRSIDGLITERRLQLENLNGLEPQYNLLQVDVKQARQRYELVLEKFNEADLKANTVQDATFIQIIQVADPPEFADSNPLKLLVFGLVGSLGFITLLVFVLDYLRGLQTAVSLPTPTTETASEPTLANGDAEADQSDDLAVGQQLSRKAAA